MEEGKVKAEDLGMIKTEMKRSKLPLVNVLQDLGLVLERDLLEIRAKDIRIPFIAVEDLSPEPEVVTCIPEGFATEHGVIALEKKGNQLLVAAADPADLHMADALPSITRCRIVFRLASKGEVLKKLGEYHDHYKAAAVERLLGDVKDQGRGLARRMGLVISDIDEAAQESSQIIRTLNLLLLQALIKRASDIHIEPSSKYLVVKYRVDGVLQLAQKLQLNIAQAVVNRIKVMSKLDIAERRLPQDGSFHISVEGRDIDFRVATTPTVNGEKVVLRILDKQAALLGLENLGFSKEQYFRLRQVLRRPNGIVVVAGPTGSGKTTSLYSCLMSLNTGTRNITTIEDPVEYQIEGLTQIQAHDDIGLSFSHILRSVLRQDPDVILVGEIRDLETTENAVRASLTGHLVFTTLHTNDATSAITRLMDMGTEPFLIASSLRAVLSQRLVRTLCPSCKEQGTPDPSILAMLPKRMRGIKKLWQPRGCRHCFNTGYRGRIPIIELLIINEDMRRAIVNQEPPDHLTQVAVEGGMVPIFHDGLLKVAAGITTLEEILSVTEVSHQAPSRKGTVSSMADAKRESASAS